MHTRKMSKIKEGNFKLCLWVLLEHINGLVLLKNCQKSSFMLVLWDPSPKNTQEVFLAAGSIAENVNCAPKSCIKSCLQE